MCKIKQIEMWGFKDANMNFVFTYNPYARVFQCYHKIQDCIFYLNAQKILKYGNF